MDEPLTPTDGVYRASRIMLAAFSGRLSPEVQAALDNLYDVTAMEVRHGQEQE